jgi:hypothetical protein
MPIPTENYEAVFEQYSAAMRWMAGLGIKLGPRRTAYYQKIVGHWKDAYKTATADEAQQIATKNYCCIAVPQKDCTAVHLRNGGK